MCAKISDYILVWCEKRCVMDEEEKAIFLCGMRYIIMSVEKFFFFLIIGYVLNCEKEIIVALATFGSIRLFAGGIHMRSSKRCTMMMGIIVGIAVTFGKVMPENENHIILLWIVSSMLVCCFAPIDFSGKRKWTCIERKKKKLKAICISSVWHLLAMSISNRVLGNIIAIACLSEMLTLLPINKGRRST